VRGMALRTAGLLLAPLVGLASAGAGTLDGKPIVGTLPPIVKPAEASCGKHGTTVEFVGTPSEAAREAKKEQKLVFILHVSGYFEDPKLT
jgi:hypothetical protein